MGALGCVWLKADCFAKKLIFVLDFFAGIFISICTQ